jgi:hypothetical protein
MGKREHYFQKIAEYKERFRKLPTEKIQHRLLASGGCLYKEAAIALREFLEERSQESDKQASEVDCSGSEN